MKIARPRECKLFAEPALLREPSERVTEIRSAKFESRNNWALRVQMGRERSVFHQFIRRFRISKFEIRIFPTGAGSS
jgi:hypothetical protein